MEDFALNHILQYTNRFIEDLVTWVRIRLKQNVTMITITAMWLYNWCKLAYTVKPTRPSKPELESQFFEKQRAELLHHGAY